MKMDNRTDWSTAHLKAIVREVAKRELLTAEELERLSVRVEHTRRSPGRADGEVRGTAHAHAWSFRLGCVKGADLSKAFLARTVSWALSYNQGAGHGTWRDDGWREKWAWAEQMPLERKQAEEPGLKAPDVRVNERMAHCLEQIVAWEKKAKLADTKLRKWKARLARHARKLREVAG